MERVISLNDVSRPKLGSRCDTTIRIPEETPIEPLSKSIIHKASKRYQECGSNNEMPSNYSITKKKGK